MFSYFPGNYVWDLSVCIALESGAKIGEVGAGYTRKPVVRDDLSSVSLGTI